MMLQQLFAAGYLEIGFWFELQLMLHTSFVCTSYCQVIAHAGLNADAAGFCTAIFLFVSSEAHKHMFAIV